MATNELRKAAILLMSLPQPEAAQLLAKLDHRQVEAVSIEIAKLGSVAGDEQAQVIQDFANSNPTGLTGGSGGLEPRQEPRGAGPRQGRQRDAG